MAVNLDAFVAAGILEPLDRQLGDALCRLAGHDDPTLRLCIAMASRQVRLGHVCLRLDHWLASKPDSLKEAPGPIALSWPARSEVQRALASAPALVGPPDADDGPEPPPLIWDAPERLYLQRYYRHERRLAEQVRRRATTAAPVVPDAALVERLFPRGERDEQRDAALGILGRGLGIITGGPGTGKTSTVARLLALHDACWTGAQPPRVLLLGPTGKAAARLGESIAGSVDALPLAAERRERLPRHAQTVHRALGLSPGRYRPRNHADNPLDCDLVIVDEASMVDLSLMRRLLDAVPAEAPVVLLGDADQLASVEAGATLGDLCEAARRGAPGLRDAVHELRTSRRYAAGSGIAQLAQRVRDGEADPALALLERGDLPDVALHPLTDERLLPRALIRELERRYRALTQHTLDAQLEALGAFRVLCAHRRGPLGVEHVNREAAVLLHGVQARDAGDYHGRPILITENDPTQRIYNGDIGVVFRRPRSTRLSAFLHDGTGVPREVSLARLPARDSVYAMSVHKSQGSELDHVAVLLPGRVSPVLSRELLYTAITRARHSVQIFASPPVLAHALGTKVLRATGLVDALLDTTGP